MSGHKCSRLQLFGSCCGVLWQRRRVLGERIVVLGITLNVIDCGQYRRHRSPPPAPPHSHRLSTPILWCFLAVTMSRTNLLNTLRRAWQLSGQFAAVAAATCCRLTPAVRPLFLAHRSPSLPASLPDAGVVAAAGLIPQQRGAAAALAAAALQGGGGAGPPAAARAALRPWQPTHAGRGFAAAAGGEQQAAQKGGRAARRAAAAAEKEVGARCAALVVMVAPQAAAVGSTSSACDLVAQTHFSSSRRVGFKAQELGSIMPALPPHLPRPWQPRVVASQEFEVLSPAVCHQHLCPAKFERGLLIHTPTPGPLRPAGPGGGGGGVQRHHGQDPAAPGHRHRGRRLLAGHRGGAGGEPGARVWVPALSARHPCCVKARTPLRLRPSEPCAPAVAAPQLVGTRMAGAASRAGSPQEGRATL